MTTVRGDLRPKGPGYCFVYSGLDVKRTRWLAVLRLAALCVLGLV